MADVAGWLSLNPETWAFAERVEQILFRTEIDFAACGRGPGTHELGRQHERVRANAQPGRPRQADHEDRVVLDEQGIEHTPCVPLDEDAP